MWMLVTTNYTLHILLSQSSQCFKSKNKGNERSNLIYNKKIEQQYWKDTLIENGYLQVATFVIKILIIALNTSYVIVVANDKEFWMNLFLTKYIFILCLAIYVLSLAIKMWIFWSSMEASDVLSHVSTFNNFKYFYYNFEIV